MTASSKLIRQSRYSWPLGRKLGLTAGFYILSILVNVAVSSACLLLYFEPAFRESKATFQEQQQLEQLRALVRWQRAGMDSSDLTGRPSWISREAGDSVSAAILALQASSVPGSLGPVWDEIRAAAASSELSTQPAEGTAPDRLAGFESRLSLAIDSLGTRRQDSLAQAFHAQRWITSLLILNSLLGATLCGAGLWFVRRWVVRPAMLLKEATNKIREGNFNPQIAMPFEDEMGMLGREIGDMAQQIACLQEQLVDRERRAAAGEMVEQVEQRVREPLSRIRQLAQASSRRNTEHEEIAECEEGIGATVQQFERWLSQLRAGLMSAGGKPSPIGVSVLFADVLAAVRPALERHQVQLSFHSSTDLNVVSVDRLAFEQALVSVVTNAIQASAAGQIIRMTAGLCDNSVECWQVEVADQGSGIAPEVLNKIFLPFFTTKRDGNGIGLSQVKSIIEQHGGVISVSSIPGQGSCFTLRLPVNPATPLSPSS